MSGIMAGPSCRNCQQTEQRCAFLQGCCGACSHWLRYDDNGKPKGQAHTPNSTTDSEIATCQAGTIDYVPVLVLVPEPSLLWPFRNMDARPTHCGACGRRTPWRTDGTRIRHRIEADNPLAPYCTGDAELVVA